MAKTAGAPPKNDAYTGLLAISFLALVGGTVLMFLDQDELGKPPAKLSIDVPGASTGKAGPGLEKANPGGGAPKADPPMGGADKKNPDMGKATPGKLPALPAIDADPAIVPTSAIVDPDAPPLVVKPFVPPQ